MFDDGILTIYQKNQSKSATGKPVEILTLYSNAWYGELGIGVAEYYSAKQAQAKVEKRVRIQQDKSIGTKHIFIVDSNQYQAGRVFHGVEKGMPITDVTLERVTAQYDIE
jgi:SPP1 family predicted phage head-tail adaptor